MIKLRTMRIFIFLSFIILIIALEILVIYQVNWRERIYPGVFVGGQDFSHWTKNEIEAFFKTKNKKFSQTKFIFSFDNQVATVSGREFNWGYDIPKISQNAYEFGRNADFFSNWKLRLKALFQGVNLPLFYSFDENKLKTILSEFNQKVYLPPQNALFRFENGRVIAFQTEKPGRQLNITQAIQNLNQNLGQSSQLIKIQLKTIPIQPEITIDQINNLGINELLGEGLSYFWGSSSSRIENIVLAASRLNGLLVKPGEVFSFNQALGDVSSATGYRQAYIIKEGKTILGDGGGVCQVSTTLFRAALNAGLPIVERHPHSYRVSYYEQGGFGPGLDATVFLPSVDLKFKNDTPAYILIQAYVNTQSKTLSFKLYGTSDGRQVIISKPKIWQQIPPPEDLYIDEPTLPLGVIKQTERKNWGAKVSFNWQVKRGEEIIHQQTFFSHYQPWQAVYLRGTGGQ